MPLFSSPLSSPSFLIPKAHQHDIRAQFSTGPPPPPPRVRIPTAPWMTTSPPDLLLSEDSRSTDFSMDQSSDDRTRSLTSRVPGGRTRKTILEVIKSVKSLQKLDPIEQFDEIDERSEESEKPKMPWVGGRSEESEKPKMPWVGGRSERDNEILVFRREKKKREATEAEKRFAPDELQRLRKEASGITRWVKAKKAGITTEVVEEIKRTWKSNHFAMVQIVNPLKKNMDRAHQILETKTGGLVILTKRDKLVIYRQNNYQNTPPNSQNSSSSEKEEINIKGSLYERETDRLLNSLGPRFIDWWWRGPLPVDADLLPETVRGFKTPSRRCPPGARLALSDAELTWLRLIARSLPTHFALGRNKKLQGLAEAIIKLWEKSLVAKIAIKVGLLNTNHVEMASELKQLTGGVVILRNKDFIILYRGKDFITEKIANSITERESQIHEIQNKEEEARIKAADYFRLLGQNVNFTGSSGSFMEYQDLKSNFSEGENGKFEDVMRLEAEKENLVKEIKDQEKKLLILTQKIESSESEMKNLKILSGAYMQDCDKELLTEEERRNLRSIGLKMDQHLMLGRRGVYDGVISTIHQHWKHREVVKVITKQTRVISVNYTAKLLELMTGGALVSVDKVRSHHEIVIYRGKNYRPPIKLSPDNLLTKREALKRSIEVQRRGSLKFFARKREESLRELKSRMSDLEEEIAKLTSEKAELPR